MRDRVNELSWSSGSKVMAGTTSRMRMCRPNLSPGLRV